MSQLPPEFDELKSSDYDPQYTADISTHMYVPERIDISGIDDTVSPADGTVSSVHLNDTVSNHVSQMTVPDKIIVLGMITFEVLFRHLCFCLFSSSYAYSAHLC